MFNLDQSNYVYLEEINEGILRHISRKPAKKTLVLDVGCGQAPLGSIISDLGYHVWGIERHSKAAAIAAGRLERILVRDLTDFQAIKNDLGDRQFDIIVFSDILEHCHDPVSILQFYLSYLRPGGRILLSLPNVAVWSNRLAVLLGSFDYSETGLMDRTHIRFFTFKSAKQLLRAVEARLVRVDYTPMIVRSFLPIIKRGFHKGGSSPAHHRTILDSPLYRIYKKYVYPVEYFLFRWWKSLFAFQIIMVAEKPLPATDGC